MAKKPEPSKENPTDFLVEQNRGLNPRGIAYDREIKDQGQAAKDVGQFALESLPGVGTAFTVADIEDELKKEEPNYVKIGMLVGTEAIGLIPGLGTAAKNMIRKGADMARQTDEVMDVASSIPKVSRKSTPSYTDAELLEADEIISEWGKGNLTNPELRSKLRDKGFNVETKRISPKMTGDDLEVVGPDGNIVRWKDMPRGTDRKPQMSNEDYDMRMAALDEIDDIKEWQKAAKKEIETGRVADPTIKTPELEESTRLLLENKITREEHLANVDKYKPVNAWDALPREPSDKAVVYALNSGQRKDGFFVLDNAAEMGVNKSSLKIGDLFNGRLDIPAYNYHDTWIVTGSSKNAEKGRHYAKAVHYRSGEGEPVKFIASEKTSERIGTGEIDKTPYATVQGYVEDLDVNAIRAKAAEYLNDPEWTQVGFDPRRQGGFYVRAGENKHVPVREATEVIQIGPLILAKNAKLDFEYEGYSEGGVAMNKQMEMAFMQEGGVPDNTVGVDPVSGNDIPVGSTAEEVRDDIPAMLSEGEYVVPADVVKYHGLALFEALRNQAKFGLREMAEDGRIGGEPIEEGMEEELTAEDQQLLQEIMSMEDEDVVKAAYGTFIPGNTSTTVPSTQVQMPTSGQTPASTQQVQPATTQQDPSGVYGIVTGSGQPVTSSTPLVNQQPVVQGVVGTTPVTGDSTTTPGTTQTGMVTKKYVAPDCRRIDVLTLNGKIISSTPADFDVFVEATEDNLKRFNCITDDEEVKVDDTTTDTTLTGGEDDGGNEPDIKTTSDPKFDLSTDKGSRDAADYFKEKSGVSVVDPFKAAQDALNNALNADTMKGAGALAGLILGPVGTLGAGVINAGSQIDALSTAYANKSMADYLGKTDVSNSIQKAIDEFLGKAPGIVKFANKSSDLGKKKMEYALLSAQSVNAPDDMALTEDRFGSSEAFNSAMNEVATAGMVYNPSEKVYERTTETVQVPTTGGGSVTVGAGTQASTASAATVDRDTGRVVFTPGEKTVRPVLRPPNLTSGSGGDDSSSAPVGVVGNNDTGSNDFLQSVANFFTPNDGKEYVDGKLVSTSSNDDNNDSPSSSESSGCCFIMLEARYGNGTMDEVVRRYRDEYMTDRNRRGYYKTAEVLVPLMRKSKVFKWVVTKTFADPLVSYGKYYYGENKHGVIFTPVKNFWMKLFDVVGGNTEFIRENGEVV